MTLYQRGVVSDHVGTMTIYKAISGIKMVHTRLSNADHGVFTMTHYNAIRGHDARHRRSTPQ